MKRFLISTSVTLALFAALPSHAGTRIERFDAAFKSLESKLASSDDHVRVVYQYCDSHYEYLGLPMELELIADPIRDWIKPTAQTLHTDVSSMPEELEEMKSHLRESAHRTDSKALQIAETMEDQVDYFYKNFVTAQSGNAFSFAKNHLEAAMKQEKAEDYRVSLTYVDPSCKQKTSDEGTIKLEITLKAPNGEESSRSLKVFYVYYDDAFTDYIAHLDETFDTKKFHFYHPKQ